jgi:anti-sigma factor RsiW
MSQYLDGELDVRQREALEAHTRECARCRSLLASLESTVRALGALGKEAPAGLADSIIDALRAEDQPEIAIRQRSPDGTAVRALAVVPASAELPSRNRILNGWRRVGPALRYCLQRRHLRLTLPIAVIAGVVLSMVNMGGMLMHGKIDLGVCLSCAVDFLVPFLALNLGLLMLWGLPRRTPR